MTAQEAKWYWAGKYLFELLELRLVPQIWNGLSGDFCVSLKTEGPTFHGDTPHKALEAALKYHRKEGGGE